MKYRQPLNKPEKIAAELFQSQPLTPKSIGIIGGGIASLCLADQILKISPSCNIKLFCMDSELAQRGSGNQQGAIYPLLQGSASVLAELYTESYPYAIKYYQSLLNSGVNFEHQWCGVLQQAFTPELEVRLKKFEQLWPNICEYISAKQSSALANLELPYSSIYYPHGGWLSPAQFCQSLSEYLNTNYKFDCMLNSKVTAIKKQSAPHFEQQTAQWQITVENTYSTPNNANQEYEFDAVVICAGHLSNDLSLSEGIDLEKCIPLQHVRGQVTQLQHNTPMNQLTTVLCHNGYVAPSQGSYQSFGATFSKGNKEETISDRDNEKNIEQLKNVYPHSSWANTITTKDIVASKAAIRATSPDHTPIIGELFSEHWVKTFVDQNNGNLKRLDKLPKTYNKHEDSDLKGLYTLTGLGARGITTAPYMAKELAHQLFDKDDFLSTRVQKSIAPMRFLIKELKRNKTAR